MTQTFAGGVPTPTSSGSSAPYSTEPAQPTAYPVSPKDPINTPPSEAALVARMRDLFARARQDRKPTVLQWQRNYRVMRNRTWRSNRLDWMPQPEIPECRSIIASCVAWLTDQRPQFDLGPVAAPYSDYSRFFQQLADDMSTAISSSWGNYLYESQVELASWDAYTYGIGIFKTCWDASLADGLGDVGFYRKDPWCIYPDPQATHERDMNYVIEARTISIQELDRRFPGAGEKFSVQGFIENVDEAPRLRTGTGTTPRANPGAIIVNGSDSGTGSYGLPGQNSRDHISRDDTGVTLLECWIREHDTTTDDNGVTKVYDYWRCICIAGPHVLLNKRADEMYPFTCHPYDFFRPEENGEFFPQAMVELLTPSQLSINHVLASLEQNVDLAANPPFKEGQKSGLQRQKINPSMPGARLTLADGDQVSGWMSPPALPLAGLELAKFHIEEMERTSGLSAISRGIAGQGRISGDVYDSAQEAGFVRVRLAQRNLEFALRQAGQKYVALIAEFYIEPRFLALVGPEGSKTVSALQGQHFWVPDTKPSQDGKVKRLPLRFMVSVRAGSMLPTSRNARIGEIDTLFGMGAVDRPVVLEAHNIPNSQAILDRIGEMEAKGTFQPPGARQRSR